MEIVSPSRSRSLQLLSFLFMFSLASFCLESSTTSPSATFCGRAGINGKECQQTILGQLAILAGLSYLLWHSLSPGPLDIASYPIASPNRRVLTVSNRCRDPIKVAVELYSPSNKTADLCPSVHTQTLCQLNRMSSAIILSAMQSHLVSSKIPGSSGPDHPLKLDHKQAARSFLISVMEDQGRVLNQV